VSESRKKLAKARRWVVKIGSALLTNNGFGLRHDSLDRWVTQIMQLRQQGIEIVLVSSGAVAEGISRLGWNHRPHAVYELQAAAAVGQMGLIQAYESCFQRYNTHTAQVLLTHYDITDRERYLNARTSLRTLIDLDVVPVVNENDTVATNELRFSDNDTLAGMVANLIEADLLVILTDQDGLFKSDPQINPDAELVHEARVGDSVLKEYAGEGGTLGRGGMLTKLQAADTAAKSGTDTVIASGLAVNVLQAIATGETIGTLLTAPRERLAARKQWLANQSWVMGKLTLDNGAVNALCSQGKSLLAVGVTTVEGDFKRGEIVACLDKDGNEIARGLVNYNADESQRIMGKSSDAFEELLGYIDEPELIHRDNLIIL